MSITDPTRPRRPFVGRRTLLTASGLASLVALGGLVDLPFLGEEADPILTGCGASDTSATDKRLVISNWPAYIDPRSKPTSTISGFEQATGITVDYSADVEGNNEFVELVSPGLSTCRPTHRDVMVLTDWMAARLVGLDWVQSISAANVPNLHANLIDPLRDQGWDPNLDYHAPWQSGLTGIAYNSRLVKEVGSFSDLISRDDLKGKITLLSEMRDTMGFMLRVVGADPDAFTDEEWGTATDALRKVMSSGQVRAVTGNNYIQDLTAGDTVACLTWSGDTIQAQLENPDIKFVMPEEGLGLWSDNMLIPNHAAHGANAERWIDYYYQPEVAARLAAWVNYICPVEGAREAMERVDSSLVDNPLIFPDDEMLRSSFGFMPLTEFQSLRYETEWTKITGA